MTEDAQAFGVCLRHLSGTTVAIDGLLPEDELQCLYTRVGQKLDVPKAAIKLTLDRTCFKPGDNFKTLKSLGISNGMELNFCRLPVLEVKKGMSIVVEGAGSDAFNGVYIGGPEADWIITSPSYSERRGHVYLQKEVPRPTVGSRVTILDTETTQKYFPDKIGKDFIIKCDEKDHQPYRVSGNRKAKWLHECDVKLVEE